MAIQSPLEESCIPTFIAQYEQKTYKTLAESVADICEQVLSKNGIRLQTESRGKEPESLREKLEKRERESGPYKDIEQIYDEIIDLAGARIILYRPEDRHTVKGILYDIFDVSKETLVERGNGYRAVHYVVYLKQGQSSSDLPMTDARTPVEIQIQSLVVWQWSQLEHPIIYKPKRDPDPEMTYALNQEIRLANLWEDASQNTRELKAKINAENEEKLAKLAKSKEQLKNARSVGHHLDTWISQQAADWAKDKSLNSGSATALMKFLDSREWRTAECLERLLKEHLGDGAQDEYSELAREYAPIKLNLVIYLIDREIMKSERNETFAFRDLDSDEEHLRKIRVILSTFIWMEHLFFPRFEWHRLLTRIEDQRILRSGIFWLSNSARQCNIEDGASLKYNEILNLRGLWD